MIPLSPGFAPPSGMSQPGGYQIPPQYMYSGVGRHQPIFSPPQLQQGMAQCDDSLSRTAIVVSFKTNGHIYWLSKMYCYNKFCDFHKLLLT